MQKLEILWLSGIVDNVTFLVDLQSNVFLILPEVLANFLEPDCRFRCILVELCIDPENVISRHITQNKVIVKRRFFDPGPRFAVSVADLTPIGRPAQLGL